MKNRSVFGIIAAVVFFSSCAINDSTANSQRSVNTAKNVNASPTSQNVDGNFVASETGTEKAKPQPGKANIQGKVFYNFQPASGIEVRLCVKSNLYGDCIGEKRTTKTDEAGEYLFTDITPKTYEIFVRVFQTKGVIFSGKYGFLPSKYKVEADQTFFVPLTNLFKSDLKVQNPKPKTAVNGRELEIKWDAYPDAAYYGIELLNYGSRNTFRNAGKIEATSYRFEQPLTDGGYRLRIAAYNIIGTKLSDNGEGLDFTVKNDVPVNK